MDANIDSHNILIPPEIIIAQIENNEVIDYDGITVTGNLDFGKLNLPLGDDGRCIIKKQVKITNSNIQGPTRILNVNFMEHIDFSGTTFINADFHGSVFSKFAGFENAIFKGYASFANVRFIDDVSFANTQFTEGTLVRFDQAIFQKDAFFWGMGSKNIFFGGESTFRYAVFHGIAEFSKAVFRGKADFSFCRFFGEYIRLLNTQFYDKVSFIGSKVKGTADFINNRFNSTSDFSYVSFYIVDFSASNFENHIYLTGAMFTRFNVQWNTIKNQLSCDDPVLLALVTNFRNLGQFDDSDNCYYRYRKQIQGQRGLGLRKVFDFLSWMSCGYGVRPFRTLCVSALLITIFAFLFWKGGGISGLQSIGDAFYYSALAFTANSKSISWIGIYKYIGLVEGFLGWFFMALFLVTLGRTWLR
jgi:uncharacterized protein YjbI with pentapeptide repeats